MTIRALPTGVSRAQNSGWQAGGLEERHAFVGSRAEVRGTAHLHETISAQFFFFFGFFAVLYVSFFGFFLFLLFSSSYFFIFISFFVFGLFNIFISLCIYWVFEKKLYFLKKFVV